MNDKYLCQCGVEFGSYSAYKYHSRTHKDYKVYKCPYPDCGGIFSHIHYLNRHILSHTSQLAHRCHRKDCGEFFESYAELHEHRKTHASQKEICTYVDCFAVLKSKRGLNQHIRVSHLRERSHSCLVDGCQETFSTKRKLQVHTERQHPRDCPYEGCRHKLRNPEDLNNHLKTYHNLKEGLIPPMKNFLVRRLALCVCGKRVSDLRFHWATDH